MKKKSLHRMLILGISSATAFSLPTEAHAATGPKKVIKQDDSAPLSPAEANFVKKLNAEMAEIFKNFSSDNRKLAMKMAEMKCGHNSCQGLGGCKTKKHACKGLNDCKNQGGCALKPNEAVKLLNAKLNGKRQNLL